MPTPPPETPCAEAPATGGSGRLTTPPDSGRGVTEPVTAALWLELSVPKTSENRPESLQLAAPKPINEMATTCGQKADRRHAHMLTCPHATNATRAIKPQCGKQAFKRRKRNLTKFFPVAK
jgi:hypothetical protein